MTVYEFILSIDKKLLQDLHRKKIIRFSIYRDIEMFDNYMIERKNNRCMQSRTNTAVKFCTSEETISRMLHRMKRKV